MSVALCCHNSARRLPQTLAHLAAQNRDAGVPWEVVVIDNASTDDTADVARSAWPPDAPARLRVVSEPRPGLQFARDRGYASTCYPVITFIDDDNWVCPDWVALVSEIMATHPEVGACGGFSEARCEVEPPAWFQAHATSYAVGAQGFGDPDKAGPRPLLWGAGLSVRRTALEELRQRGFRPQLHGRQGKGLGSGEDTEECLGLRLAGWELWYDPRLRMTHFIPASRLQWAYVRRLSRAFGATLLDPYWFALDPKAQALPAWRRSWLMIALRELRTTPRWLGGWWRGLGGGGEGDARVLAAERSIGRWGAILRSAGTLGERYEMIQKTARRRTHPNDPPRG